MITFVKEDEKNVKKWQIFKDDEKVFDLNLISSSITNKFFIVTTFIENISKVCGEEFDEWLINLLNTYKKDIEKRPDTIIENIPALKAYVDQYLDSIKIDYSQFVDESKAKKGSILFKEDEIELITKMSSYLKIYSLISNSIDLKLSQKPHKRVYNAIMGDILESEVIYKIFNVIRSKVYRYNLTDKYMWDYIKMIQCKTIDVHVIEIFNFIMNAILVLCEENRNPIIYFVSVVEESVKWFLRSVYKGSIIYEDSISTENIHTLSTNNLKTYSYNDTLGRLKGIAFEQIYDKLERAAIVTFDKEPEDKLLIDFQNRVTTIEFISPLCEYFVFPLLSTMTKIPYVHFKTLEAGHATVLSVYLESLLVRLFKRNEYSNLFSLLKYYPTVQPAIATSYQIKQIHDYLNLQQEHKNFYGFNTKILPHKIISYFVGRISRINFCNVLDGQDLGGIPLSKLESEMIHFYSLLFAGKLNNEISKLRSLMNVDF